MKNGNSKTSGGVSQSICAAHFSSMGYIVSQPLYDNARYDLIVDDGKSLQKVQCKTGYKDKKQISHDVRLGCNPSNTHVQKRYVYGDFDLLWVLAGTSYYLIPFDDLPKEESTLAASFALTEKYITFRVFPDFLPAGESSEKRFVTPLTDSEKDRIVSLYKSGESSHSIALTMGLPTSKVSSFLTNQGVKHQDYYMTDDIKLRISEMYTSGVPIVNISQEIGFSMSSVSRAIAQMGVKRYVVKMTDDLRNQIVKLHRSGMKAPEIARTLKMSPKSVDSFLRKNKWAIENISIASA